MANFNLDSFWGMDTSTTRINDANGKRERNMARENRKLERTGKKHKQIKRDI